MNDVVGFKYEVTVFLTREGFFDKKGNQHVRKLAIHLEKIAPVYYVHKLASTDTNENIESPYRNLEVFDSSVQSPLTTIRKVLRLIRRNSMEKVLIVICDPSYSTILPWITTKYSAVYFTPELDLYKDQADENALSDNEDQLKNVRHTLKYCSGILTDSAVSAMNLRGDSGISVPVIQVDHADFSLTFEHFQKLPAVKPIAGTYKKRVLILYDRNSCHVSNLRENLDAFGLFSRHHITYIDGCGNKIISNEFVQSFDAIAVHYSVRLSKQGHLSEDMYKSLCTYTGLKILFIQDEYDNLSSTYKYLEKIDFDVLYTVINIESAKKLYPKEKFPNLRIIPILTGYVPYNIRGFFRPKMEERTCDVFYRGRELPYEYGTLGREKFEIGKKFEEACLKHNVSLNLDLDSDNSKRIYGDLWYHVLSKSKTMLGTESGSNVFDFKGDLSNLIQDDIVAGLSYDEIYEKRLKQSELEWKVNTISPKVFESIILGTVPILYEGEYSGILVPGRHYISLKKDFSNFEEVVAIVNDTEKLKEIADCAFQEIVENPIYSYEHFIKNLFDEILDEEVLVIKVNDILVTGNYHKYNKEVVNGVTYDVLRNYPAGYSPPMLLSSEAEMHYDFQIVFQSTVLKSKRYLKNKLLTLMQDERKYISKTSSRLFAAFKFGK